MPACLLGETTSSVAAATPSPQGEGKEKAFPTGESDRRPDEVAPHSRQTEEQRQRTDKSFFVPRDEIAANGYDLSINKYKKTEYKPVEYPSTQEIMADLRELEMQITQGLAELEGML